MSTDVTQEQPGSLNASVAEEIRALLARRRVRQSQLARELGVSEQWISVRLRGVQAMDLDDLERIAKVLRCRIVDLLPAERITQPPAAEAPLSRSADRPNTRPRSTHPRDTRPTRRTQPPDVRRPHRRTAQIPAAAMTLTSGAWAA